MISYENEEAATAAGDFVTHTGSCGLCSTKQDLSIYMAFPDLTWPGKKCGMESLFSYEDAVQCFMDLGFTKPCSQIWVRDAMKTSESCKWTCFKEMFNSNNGPAPMCNINDCL